MGDEFFISAPRLTEHQALCRQECLQAQALRDAVRALRNADNVAVDDRCRRLLREADHLVDYVRQLSRCVENLDEETWRLIRRIHQIVTEAAEDAREAARFPMEL